jgi:hypothetical protein
LEPDGSDGHAPQPIELPPAVTRTFVKSRPAQFAAKRPSVHQLS